MVEYAETARTGRQNQLFSPTGARIVAGCVCLNSANDRVLLVGSSAKKHKWVLPKGGVETDEIEDYSRSAARETWEEAGVTGDIVAKLPIVEDLRAPKQWGPRHIVEDPITGVIKNPPRSEFHFYEMHVEKEHDVYPESKDRKRKWFTFEEAVHELLANDRKELARALEHSSCKR